MKKHDIILDQMTAMHAQMHVQMTAMNEQLLAQNQLILELKQENKQILSSTQKMGKHIDFINGAYEKITKSYLFKNIFT